MLNEASHAFMRAKPKRETNWLSLEMMDFNFFSPLSQINIDNVSDLKLNWELLPDAIQFSSTPLAVEGMLYFTGD